MHTQRTQCRAVWLRAHPPPPSTAILIFRLSNLTALCLELMESVFHIISRTVVQIDLLLVINEGGLVDSPANRCTGGGKQAPTHAQDAPRIEKEYI